VSELTTVSEPTTGSEPTTAGEVFSSHINQLMKSEFERRQRLETRGQAVMTTSAGLLTLFVAIATFMTHENYHFANRASIVLICCSFGIFVLASALGIATQNAFTSYLATSNATLDKMVDSHWNDDVNGARWICARRHITTIKSLRIQNARKSWLALAGPVVQLVAITLLAFAVLMEVLSKFG
jgi:hypothetical protein